MKHILCTMLAAAALVFAACDKDDDDFKYDKETLYGTWQITHISSDGNNYIAWPYEQTTATFSSDGTYIGLGYFGTGSGTYKLSGSTVTTYVGGEKYISYKIINLQQTTCELKMSEKGTSVNIKCKKM